MGLLKDFKYHAPKTIPEALRLLEKSANPCLLAGGTFVLNYLKKAAKYPTDVISLKKIAGLKGIKEDKSGVTIGAMTTISELLESAVVKKYFPSLSNASGQLATTPLRHMATIGGNIASRFYWVDLPTVLISLGAKVSLCNRRAKETIVLEDFLTHKNTKKFILSSIFLPKKDLAAFYFRHTKAGSVDLPSVALAFAAQKKKTHLKGVRLVVNTASSFPVVLKKAEILLEGPEISAIKADLVVAAAKKDLEETKLDEYRRHCVEFDLETAIGLIKGIYDKS